MGGWKCYILFRLLFFNICFSSDVQKDMIGVISRISSNGVIELILWRGFHLAVSLMLNPAVLFADSGSH